MKNARVVAPGILVFAIAASCSGPAGGTGSSPSGSSDAIPAARPAVPVRPMPDLEQPHALCVHDLVRARRVGEPVPSPDGRWVCFTIQSWDPEANKKTTSLWLVARDGATTRQLTTAKQVADSGPVWSPDSKWILFTSNREGSGKAWVVRAEGGEPKKLLELPVDVDNLRLAPDGSRLAFSAEVDPDATPAETAKRAAEVAKNPVKARTYDRLMVRHWDTWFEGRRSHLFTAALAWDANGAPSVTGEPVDLMKGIDADCPTKPFGGLEDFVFSPDSTEITYVAQLGADMAWSTNLDLFTVAVTGGPARCLTAKNKASDKTPAYSPDGKLLAYTAMARPGFEADRLVVHLIDRATGADRMLTQKFDRSIDSLLFTPDSRHLIVTADEEARHRVFAVEVASGATSTLLQEHTSDALAILPPVEKGAPPRLLYRQDSFTRPAELFTAALDGSDRLRLTRVNDAQFDKIDTSEADDFWFVGANGERVHSWIAKPVGFQKGKRYPLAFVIHGGPQGAINDHFHYRWNLLAFAGAGYGVMTVNFHGSTGFGQTFTDSISGDWGGKPFEDLMKGLDAALKQFDWIDATKIGALGASYGGWMINWVNGHTDRFQCLVCHDGEFDEFSSYFATEELWFPEWEFRGVPWQKPELYEKFSPRKYLANWKTPELVIHSANDFRLVESEGLSAFTALQRRGVPSRFVWFPDENHWVLKPKNSIFWHENVIEWLDRWLLSAGAPAGARG
jgi:dipeptidyl aminopeptidase/acylaminoacyl peptidase